MVGPVPSLSEGGAPTRESEDGTSSEKLGPCCRVASTDFSLRSLLVGVFGREPPSFVAASSCAERRRGGEGSEEEGTEVPGVASNALRCQAEKSLLCDEALVLVVPYRHRAAHLHAMMERLFPYLEEVSKKSIPPSGFCFAEPLRQRPPDFACLVVEQVDPFEFHKGSCLTVSLTEGRRVLFADWEGRVCLMKAATAQGCFSTRRVFGSLLSAELSPVERASPTESARSPGV